MGQFEQTYQVTDDDSRALRAVAIASELERRGCPHSARNKIKAVLMKRSFPLGSELADQHAADRLINAATAELDRIQ